MDFTDTQNIIITTITDFGLSVLAIITSVLVIALAYLVFKFGWNKLIDVMVQSDGHDFWDRQWQKRANNQFGIGKD